MSGITDVFQLTWDEQYDDAATLLDFQPVIDVVGVRNACYSLTEICNEALHRRRFSPRQEETLASEGVPA